MTDTPVSPKARRLEPPSWLDARLVLGVLLVLVSVVVGARLLSAADQTDLVWAASRDLAPGTALTAQDLRPQEVRLLEGQVEYLDAEQPPPTGNVVQRGLLAGELVPAGALKPPTDVPYRQVTVSIEAGHAPPRLAVGQQVDVYVTPEDAPLAAPAPPSPGPSATPSVGLQPAGSRLVLAGLAVADVPEDAGFGGSADVRAIVLNVAPDDVLTLVRAVAEGRLDLVRLPADGLTPVPPGGPAGQAEPSPGSPASPEAG